MLTWAIRRVLGPSMVSILGFLVVIECACHNDQKKEPSVCITADISQSGTNLRLRNLNTFDWHEVTISINSTEKSDGFAYSVPKVAAGTTMEFPLRGFIREDGMRFKPDDFVYLNGSLVANEGILMAEFPCNSGNTHGQSPSGGQPFDDRPASEASTPAAAPLLRVPGPDEINRIWYDPKFHALPLEARRYVMKSVDPDFAALPPAAQDAIFKSTAKAFGGTTPGTVGNPAARGPT